jgi:hypothetical protein
MRYRREPAERGPEPGRRGGAWVRALSIDMPYGFVAPPGLGTRTARGGSVRSVARVRTVSGGEASPNGGLCTVVCPGETVDRP